MARARFTSTGMPSSNATRTPIGLTVSVTLALTRLPEIFLPFQWVCLTFQLVFAPSTSLLASFDSIFCMRSSRSWSIPPPSGKVVARLISLLVGGGAGGGRVSR